MIVYDHTTTCLRATREQRLYIGTSGRVREHALMGLSWSCLLPV
jgi:hypothetical protein